MFQLFFFIGLLALLLYLLLPKYLLSIYRRYRGDVYWKEVQPYKHHYPVAWVVWLFFLASLGITELTAQHVFYLLFIAFLLSLSWLDLKLRILADELVLALAVSGLLYHYFVLDGSILLRLAIVILWGTCAKIFQVSAAVLKLRRLEHCFGAGDTKLLLALLCWFDTLTVLHILTVACCLALAVVGFCSVFFKKTIRSVAFGPFLSFAAYFMWWFEKVV